MEGDIPAPVVPCSRFEASKVGDCLIEYSACPIFTVTCVAVGSMKPRFVGEISWEKRRKDSAIERR